MNTPIKLPTTPRERIDALVSDADAAADADADADADDHGVARDTEHAMALEMAMRGLPTLRWTPGMGWMFYNGQHWERDDKHRHYDLARRVAVDAAQRDPRQRVRLLSARTRNGVDQMAMADPRLTVSAQEWDAKPMELNTPGGIVDLATGEVRPRHASDYVSMCTSVAVGHFNECPRWIRFLAEIFPGASGGGDAAMIDFIQRSIGYMLTGKTSEHVLWFFLGVGANGKSVLVDLLQWMLGSYSTKLPASSLMTKSHEGHPTDIAGLHGKRLAVSSELEHGQHFAEAKVKELTGDTTVKARFMRQDFFEFSMTHKHLIAGNFRPRLHGDDPAMSRRLLLVPFNETFDADRRDRTLLDQLKIEGPGILAWAVRGAVLWRAGGLNVPAQVTKATEGYFADNNDVATWREECCEIRGEESSSWLYESYSTWKRLRGESVPSLTNWGERMGRVNGIVKRKSHGRMLYAGISLSPAERARQDRGGMHYGEHRE